ncbi:adenylate/guanylate cyclase domain-containing protein [Thermodesulfobacteriota bacterium]
MFLVKPPLSNSNPNSNGVNEMKCPNCHNENPDNKKFCGDCGHQLSSSPIPSPQVSSIDEKIGKIQRYLPNGLTEKILSQKDKIEDEHKQVTVMFCDMEGFTPLVEKLGPEKAYSIMDEVYEVLIHNVHEYEGTVNEMTGDGIMALFGAPIALEDAPQRALRSALAIHRGINDFNRNIKGMNPVKMRIGVHTGPAVVGTLGNDLRVEFKAVGDTVNMAARMEGLAEAGTTFLTEDTFKLTEGLFLFKALGERAVKGRSSSIPIYKLLSVKKDIYRPRIGFERSIYSEMVGRDKELSRLEFQVMKAIQGEGSIVNIIGEAGIGKSRLIAELKNREVMKEVAVLEGRAISLGRNLCFHPIIDLLKQWAQIKENDSERTAFDKLEAAVRTLNPEEMGEVLPFVATLMRMKLSDMYAERVKGIEGEALEKLIFKCMRELLIKSTELIPLVVVAEDLHWADTSTIELMESIFRLVETQRIVFVNVFRPGHNDTGGRISEKTKEEFPKHSIEILLQPLDKELSELLIHHMVKMKGLHHPVIDQIVERSDGNPFFIEEVVRSFIDEGAVIIRDGKLEATDKIDTLLVPYSIHDVLMARIDRLDERTRDLIKIASVIGRNFFYRILAEVAKTNDNIDKRLEYLKDIHLIRERRRMQELEYLFKHALAQEAVYESILFRKRKELHLKVANSLEKVFSERLHEFYGTLSLHYSMGEDEEKAEEYLIKAGEEALKASASNEALYYYQKGLRLYLKNCGDAADPEKLADFEKNIALAFFNKGQYANAVRHSNRALERWGVRTSQNKIIMLIKFIYDLLIVIVKIYFPTKKVGKPPNRRDNEVFDLSLKKDEALIYIDNKKAFFAHIDLLRKSTEFDITKLSIGAQLWITSSGIFSFMGLSFKLSKKFLEYSKRIMDKNKIGNVIVYKALEAVYNHCVGKWDEVRDYDETAVDLALRNGEFWSLLSYIVWYAGVKAEKGEFRDVEMLVERLSGIEQVYGIELAGVYRDLLKIDLLIKTGKLYEAKRETDIAVLFADKRELEPIQLKFLGFKVVSQVLLKDFDGAEASISKAEELIANQDFLPSTYLAIYLVGRFMKAIHGLKETIDNGDSTKLSKYRKEAYRGSKVALKNATKYAPYRTKVLRLMGQYYWLIGKQGKAVKWWNKAIQEGENLGARVDLSQTYFEVGKHLLDRHSKYKELNGISADGYLEKARTMFQEMDLKWDLDELDKIAAAN